VLNICQLFCLCSCLDGCACNCSRQASTSEMVTTCTQLLAEYVSRLQRFCMRQALVDSLNRE
jgi:hypothetical protein